MKTCNKCGEEILDNSSKFCPKCGAELKIMNSSNTNENQSKTPHSNKSWNDDVDKLVDNASNALNQVINQAKIEKNYIKYRLEDNEKTQIKGDEFIVSEKIANAIDNITNEKEKVKKTKINIEDEK